MIRFEVTGETAEEFAANALKAFGMLAIGLQQALSVAPPLKAQTSGLESSLSASKDHPSPALVADAVDDLFIQNATTSDGSSQAPKQSEKPKSGSKSSKAPKLDDLKARLSDVITSAVERGWDVKRANAYALKLIREFGAEKVSGLKPEQFAEFMELSADYVAGHIAE